MMRHKVSWRRTLGLSAVAIGVGAVIGVGGTTLALWNADLQVTANTQTGYEYFAAGLDDTTHPATDGTATVTIGGDHAAELFDNAAVAIGLTTESISQGNTGLRYTITEPDWGDQLFGAATTRLFAVDDLAACSLEAGPKAPGPATSTPVDAQYSRTDEPVVEHWCLVAELAELPDEGKHSSTVTVTGQDPAEDQVEATDDWSATITTGLDPAEEPDHELVLTYETFRPAD